VDYILGGKHTPREFPAAWCYTIGKKAGANPRTDSQNFVDSEKNCLNPGSVCANCVCDKGHAAS